MVQVYSNGSFTARPEIVGTFGTAATTHWLATATAMRILEAGGNAFDAAVAAGFALQVLEPHLNGPGGEVSLLFWDEASESAAALCGQGTAPGGATIAHFQSLGLDHVPGTGLLPACVPGAVGAWLTLLRDYGRLSLEDVLAPAIEYAGGGHPVTPRLASTIASMRPLFEAEWTASAAIYLPHGEAPAAGTLFRNPPMAATFRRLLDTGAGGSRDQRIERAREAWYRGFVADELEALSRTPVLDSTGERHSGLLTAEDIAGWAPAYEAAFPQRYGAAEVFKCGSWTQGPAMLQWLALLDPEALAAMDPLSDAFVHAVVEAGKLAMADRDCWLGDGAPVAPLLQADYLAARRALLGESASHELRPGAPGGRAPVLPPFQTEREASSPDRPDGSGEPTFAAVGRGEPTFGGLAPAARSLGAAAKTGDTCQISVADRDGNVVSATSSGGWLQASPISPALGFGTSTRGQMFWLDPRLPGALAPRRRPRTTLTPTLARLDDGRVIGLGTPGGDQQEQWSIAMLLRHLHHGLSLQEAIEAPGFHTDGLIASFWPRRFRPGVLTLESRFPAETVSRLRERGHAVKVAPEWSLGRLCAVSRSGEAGAYLLRAAANPRNMQDYAAGR